jgi:hypothetical protein
VLANALDCQRPTGRFHFCTDRGVRHAEAVAQRSIAVRKFLPYEHSKILGLEPRSCGVEVHDLTPSIRTEPIIAWFKATKGGFRQQRFDSLQINGRPGRPALRAPTDIRLNTVFGAAARHEVNSQSQYRPWSALQSQVLFSVGLALVIGDHVLTRMRGPGRVGAKRVGQGNTRAFAHR